MMRRTDAPTTATGVDRVHPVLRCGFLGAHAVAANHNRLLLLSLMACFLPSMASAQPSLLFEPRGAELRKAMIPIYDGMEREPSVLVRADRIYTDYQRKGFFRIGLLPMAVMEGVTLEVRQVHFVTNGLAQAQRWLASPTASRLEMRQVAFVTSGPATNRLEAGRAYVTKGGRCDLVEGVRFTWGTNVVQASRASLQIAGQQAGQVVFATTPPVIKNLFAPTESVGPSITSSAYEN